MTDATKSALTELLLHTDFPATRQDLLRIARRGDDGLRVATLLKRLPERSFNGIWDVRSTLENDLALVG